MSDSSTPTEKQMGRNEPCPCGSGKKYKRCHGVNAAPKLSIPAGNLTGDAGAGVPGMPGGMPDMSGFDPQMMMQVSQSLQRLPKGQLQRLQGLMQRAMSGQDISREAQEFEQTLPTEFQEMLKGFAGAGMPGMGAPAAIEQSAAAPEGELTVEQAKEIVAKAAAEGKLSSEQADDLLAVEKKPEAKKGFWRR